MYLLLEQNKGHWIKNSANANTFDPDQVKERFNPATFKKINKALAKRLLFKRKMATMTSVSMGLILIYGMRSIHLLLTL